MSILVCGGAGYIGSHTVKQLLKNDEKVIVVDNLETGHFAAIDPKAKFYQCDIRNKNDLQKVFDENEIEAVINFAAYISANESVLNPLKYFNNNIYGTQILLEVLVENNVDKMIFSSSAAVYGEPKEIPIFENAETRPTNPYGESKLITEKMIHWVSAAHNVNYVSLRYFNAAGAIENASIGEDHNPESHLISLIFQTLLNKKHSLTVFGTDYPTPDGTCIRDYIHVIDLADAHLCALNYLRANGVSDFFNLGTGNGFSIKEIIDVVEDVTGKKVNVIFGERRAGDPARLIASNEKAKKILGWNPQFSSIRKIISTAWNWHSKHPNGYDS